MNDVSRSSATEADEDGESLTAQGGTGVAPVTAEASSSVHDALAARSMIENMPLGTRRKLATASVIFLVATVVLMATSVVLSVMRGPQGPWRGEFFDNQKFEGDPTIRYTRKIEYDYGKGAPFRGIPKDDWSVIWTTCMHVDEETEMKLRISSDDGSRFYVDDELVVDNWGLHATRTRSGKITLEPGDYHLRLDYYEARHGAVIKLLAAFDDETEHEVIPPAMLSQPGGGESPCD